MKTSYSFRREFQVGSLITAVAFFLICAPLFSQEISRLNRQWSYPSLAENWEARKQYENLIKAPLNRLSDRRVHTYRQLENGETVRFRIKKENNAVFLLFERQDPYGMYPSYLAGNASIKRDWGSGEPAQMTFLLRDRNDCYVRIYPRQGRVAMEIKLFDVLIHKTVMLPVSFDVLTTSPFSRIVELTSDRVDWETILHQGKPDPRINEMITVIRKQIPYLKDCDDGAYNSRGVPVYIGTGAQSTGGMNCSGFAKWVVDGFYYPLKNRYSDIGELKGKAGNLRGNRWSERYERERDPYFGLDWSRNLATVLEEARRGYPVMNRPVMNREEFDIRDVPYYNYIEDVGYPVADLKLILFLLGSRDPNRFYIGSVNQDFGSDPQLRQHIHLVLLFPTFAPDGAFDVTVMERNEEMTLGSLKLRYKNDFIHLVGLQAEGVFSPQSFKVD